MGLWAAIAITPLLWLFLAFAKPLLLFMNEPAQLVDGAMRYIVAMSGGLPFILAFNVLRNFVTALSRPRAVLFIMLAMIVVNLAGNYIFIFGHFGAPALGVVGSGLSSAFANAFSFFVLLIVTLKGRAFAPYRILRRFHRPDWGKLKEVFHLGGSIGGAQLFEVMLFAASTFLMGLFGTAALAAHQISMNVPSITFMVPLGIGMAATVRVGLGGRRGRHPRRAARGAGRDGIGGGFMALCGIGLALFPRTIVGFYLHDTPGNAGAIALATTFLQIAAAFQVFDGLQVIGVCALRGLKDARVPMWLAGGAYWLVGFPLAVALGFGFGLEGLGVWLGLAAALFAAAAVMVLRFLHKSGIL